MRTSDFDYALPEERIAQTPVEPRDHARLMVCNLADDVIQHRHFYDLPEYLRPEDVLVLNETRVLPARLYGQREDTGGAIEFLLLKRIDKDRWEVILRPGRRAKPGVHFTFGEGQLTAEVESTTPEGGRIVRFFYAGVFEALLDELGQMPLPPYIHEKLADPARYQTVYAREDGSAAAPTAGLHFTSELLARIRAKGVDIVPILLHVGLGTFRPVKEEDLSNHHMHSEYYAVSEAAAERINAARPHGGRIVCVGTTCVRTLESVADEAGIIHPGRGETSIFITPEYKLRAVDALVTNFHLPKSTLLMLVASLMGRERMLAAYAEAIGQEYRFFSFGDAMLIEGHA